MSSSDRHASASGNGPNPSQSRGSDQPPSRSPPTRYPPGHVEHMRSLGQLPSHDEQISPYSRPARVETMVRRSTAQPIHLFDHRIIPTLRIPPAMLARLFTPPPLPPSAMTPIQQRHSQILTHPAPSAFRRDGTIMRTWLGTAIPGEFRKNNNCLKASAGTIAHMGRLRLNLSAPYWDWLMSQEAPTTLASTSAGALARRAVLCDEQHNRDAHSRDGAHYVCPHPHALDDGDGDRWEHGYEHIVCAACEAAQPRACSPIVRMVLAEGPLVAMCEGCAMGALRAHGAGHNGCGCARGALGGLCLRHQNEEGEHLARRWLAYRARHHGPGGWDGRTLGGRQVVVPYCRCGRVPVPRGWRPFAFWCAACEGPVVMPRMGEGWRGGRRPQRWLVVGNLPVVDYDAEWMRSPSNAPSYRQGGPVVDPDRYRGARGQAAGVGPARAPSGEQRPSSMVVVPPWRRPPSVDLNEVDDDDDDYE